MTSFEQDSKEKRSPDTNPTKVQSEPPLTVKGHLPKLADNEIDWARKLLAPRETGPPPPLPQVLPISGLPEIPLPQYNLTSASAKPLGLSTKSLSESTAFPDLGWAELVLDIVGIIDPTSVSDLMSGLISLSQGDYWGAVLSGISMAPGADLATKPIKIAREIISRYPNLAKFSDRIMDIVHSLQPFCDNIDKLDFSAISGGVKQALEFISKRQDELAEALQKLSQTDLEVLRKTGLPINGPIPFIPPPKKEWLNGHLPRTPDGGYVDIDGRVWKPDRTKGVTSENNWKEWDVQLKPRDQSVFARFGKDSGHVNVGHNGVVTH